MRIKWRSIAMVSCLLAFLAFCVLLFCPAKFAVASTVAFLPMDGAEGCTSFADTEGNIWTAVGNVYITHAVGGSNGASAYFAGGGSRNNVTDYLGVANQDVFGFTGPFTVDFKMYPLNIGKSSQYIAGEANPDGGYGWDMRIDNLHGIEAWGIDGWYGSMGGGNGVLVGGEWNDVMLSATSDHAYLYINGTLVADHSRSPIGNGGNPFRIGFQSNYGGPGFYGYIDDFRISDVALTPSPVPIPGALWLLGSGLLGLLTTRGSARKRKLITQE